MRLRRRFRVVVPNEAERIVTLLDSHLRREGEATAHNCVICLGTMKYNVDLTPPDWSQCPNCSGVVHQACLEKWIAETAHPTQFTCPNCRAPFECDAYEEDPDLWSADAVIDKLKGEFDPSFEDDKDESRSDDESHESEGSDDDESDDMSDDGSSSSSENDSESADASPPPFKRTRSHSRPPPQADKRVLRSRS